MHKPPEKLHEMLLPRLAHIGSYEAACGVDYPPHSHSQWELVFYRRGNIQVPIGEELFSARPGILLLTPPDTTHAELAITAYANLHAGFEAPADYPWPREVCDDEWGSLAHTFGTLHREYEAKKPDSARLIESLVTQLDVILRRSAESESPSSEESLVREAERLWEEDFAQAWSIPSTAHEIGCAPSHLRACFALQRQLPPMEALFKIRVRHALARLASSNDTLDKIAQECGFHSASHLSRRIKDFTGRSPGQWRNSKSVGLTHRN